MEFEKQFSDFQADMVSICLEYCEKKADTIFIYTIYWQEKKIMSSTSTNFFFRVNNEMRAKHKIDGDVSFERQKATMKILAENATKIAKLFEQHNRPLPSEMKIVYDVNTNSIKADYTYDLDFAGKGSHDLHDEWFNSFS